LTVDLLVVNYSTRHLLQRLLDTLHSDLEKGVWKLYLADNDSTDDSHEWIKNNAEKYQLEEVIFNKNIGYSAAINDLAHRSNSELLCAVNADTWFTTRHVKQAARSFKLLPYAGVIGVKQMDEQKHIRHGGIFWDKKSNPIHRGWNQHDPEDKLYKDITRCWTVSGSIYYVRRETWNSITNYKPYRRLFPDVKGAFLPTPHFFEETFCSQMAHHLGYDVVYDGSVETAGHTWHASSEVGAASRDYFNTSRQIYMQACDQLGIEHECK
jgi:GT2 family glycosyltransferase